MSDATANGLELVIEEVMGCAASLRQLDRSESGTGGLSLSQQAVLEAIQQHSDLTVPQLARRRGTSRQNVQVLVDRLAGAGFVRYVENPDHRRSERVHLTASGRRALSSGRRSHAARVAALLPDATEDQVHACLELLRTLRARLGSRRPASGQAPVRPRGQGRRKDVSKPTPPIERLAEPLERPIPDPSPPDELPVSLL